MADLDREEDFLLELLQPAEELRAVIPAMRCTPSVGEEQVLVGVTDRRVVLIGRRARSETSPVRLVDVTDCASMAPRGEHVVPHDGGHLAFDVDGDALARMWDRIDALDRQRAAAAD